LTGNPVYYDKGALVGLSVAPRDRPVCPLSVTRNDYSSDARYRSMGKEFFPDFVHHAHTAPH